MEKQAILNAIGCLTGTMDAFVRCGKTAEADAVAAKILELIKQL